MARRSNLSRRIERLLNESSFHRAFAGSRARRLIALVLVPLALVAATAAVRVQASDQNLLAAQPAAAPAAPTAPAAAAEPADPSEPAESAEPDESATSPEDTADSSSATLIQESANNNGITVKNGAHMYLNSDGDSWALVPSKPGAITFSGTYSHITQKQLDHAREQAHGPLLWIMHGGKSYFVTDPSILREFQSSMDRMEVLGGMQNVLGKQQEALGKQQEALAQAQEARGKIVVPDLSKEKAEIDRAMSELEKHKGEALSQEDLAGMQQRLADMQGRLGQLQGKMGAQMGQLGSQMGKLGAMQGTLGARQGKIGSEQGRIGKGINSRVQSEIGEWIREGKARPIE
jgi:hypothetical protein